MARPDRQPHRSSSVTGIESGFASSTLEWTTTPFIFMATLLSSPARKEDDSHYANQYDDLKHLHANIAEFIEQYYNRQRLHSALGYCSPEEFEQQAERPNSVAVSTSATMRFFQA